MSSYDKVVKLACKPKNAPPKSKYIDTIIAATWSEDGAVHDVCKALSPRFREPNSVIVFKALIVLHTMIRNGATDNVLAHLSQSDVLRLRNVYSGSWEGFQNPDHLHAYARYLDLRIRAYRDLKHDAIKVQSETNRDLRVSSSAEEQGYRNRKDAANKGSSLSRSQTVAGRKLRSMTVEKGLLRETKVVHQMIDSLVECRFYMDGVDDELHITALRMLVKDLLILFQAGNEAIINILEQYFEMSFIDASEALRTYRHFCKQTELVTEYLGVAKKLQNLLNVPVPTLRHAPLSLATALQEYIDDPNFEQNRVEYKANRAAAEGKPTPKTSAANNSKAPTTNAKSSIPTSSNADKPSASAPSTSQQQGGSNVDDFFSSIEAKQSNTAPLQTTSPAQQAVPNPFSQMMAGQQPFAVPQITTQPTGFLMPQQTAMPMNALGIQGQQPAPNHRPFSSYLSPDQTFLQPQTTGANPFRQSMLVPQTTGMALFGVGGNPAMTSLQPGPGPFPPPTQSSLQPFTTGFNQGPFNGSLSPASAQQQQQQPFQPIPASTSMVPLGSSSTPTVHFSIPQRPASTPLTTRGNLATKSSSPPPAQPVKTHQTGTRNPFGPIITPAPPIPKPPTLMELAMGSGSNSAPANVPPQQQQQQPGQANGGVPNSTSGFNFATSALNPGGTSMGNVASSFALGNAKSGPTSPTSTAGTTVTGSTFSDSLFSGPSSLSSQPTGMTGISATASLPTGIGGGFGTGTGGAGAPLKPQMTGFAGLKPFKPTSSFGAALMESIPQVPNSNPASPPTGTQTPSAGANTPGASTVGSPSMFGTSMFGSGPGALNAQPAGVGGVGGLGALNAQQSGFGGSVGGARATSPTGMSSSLGVGLRPQLTGGGAANPFRASMAAGGSGFGSSFGSFGGGGAGVGAPSVPPLPAGFGNGSAFGSTMFSGGAFGGTGSPFGQQQPGQQQQQHGQGNASLI